MSLTSVVDHLGREVIFSFPPQRIVSLCPSQTETLVELGLLSHLVGRTRYCVRPRTALKAVPTVSGTKTFTTVEISALRPDLVIAEKEENPKDRVLDLVTASIPVYVTDVSDLKTARKMILDLGGLTGTRARAEHLVSECDRTLSETRGTFSKMTALYLIWRNPWMAAHEHTYIHAVLEHLGFENACRPFSMARPDAGRYPALSAEDMRILDPDVVFLPSEPFPFRDRHAAEIREILPRTTVLLIDGEPMSWYGARMRELKSFAHSLRENLERVGRTLP